MSINRGKFIVLEGSEGSGKTLQTELLCQHLTSIGIQVYQTKEATDGPIGKIIHDVYLSGKRVADNRLINLLYVADRLDHITNSEDGILDMINNGTTVISDRYYMSSAAYHASFFFDNKERYHREMVDIIDKNMINRELLKPDLTILLDVRPSVAYERVSKRKGAPEIFDNMDSLKKLKVCYDDATRYLSNIGDTIITINGNLSIDEVQYDINSIVDNFLRSAGVI